MRLGAPIFVRSYVGSYARLLGLPATLADEVVRGKAAPQLAPIGSDSPRRGAFDRGVMNLAYLAMTVLIVGSVVMLAMYFQGPRRTSEVLPLDPPAAFALDGATPESIAHAPQVSQVMASLAPSISSAPSTPQLTIEFHGASWIDGGEWIISGIEQRQRKARAWSRQHCFVGTAEINCEVEGITESNRLQYGIELQINKSRAAE